jgi:hypothetical protein
MEVLAVIREEGVMIRLSERGQRDKGLYLTGIGITAILQICDYAIPIDKIYIYSPRIN